MRQITRWLPAAVLAVVAMTSPMAGSEPLTLDEVIRLVKAGVGSAIIEHKVESSGLAFEADVDAIITLREAGADDIVVKFIIDQADREGPSVTAGGAGVSPAPLPGHREEPASGATGTSASRDPRVSGVRVLRRQSPAGGEILILTNLDPSGRKLEGSEAPVRGIISSAARAAPEQAVAAAAAITAPASTATPASVEVTIRDDRAGGAADVERLAERIDALESPPGRPPVGADFPRHPVNDHRDQPLYAYPWGYPILLPVAFEAQEFRTQAYGPFTSFSSAYRAGIDPFRPLPACQPGVACSVAQRRAHP